MEQMLTHTDFNQGYRIKYPASWQKRILAPATLAFLSPLEGPGDVFSDNVILEIKPFTVPFKDFVAGYLSLQTAQFEAAGVKSEPIGQHELTLAGLPAHRVEFQYQTGPVNKPTGPAMVTIRVTQYFVARGQRAYALTFNAEDRAYEKFLPMAEAIIGSLELSE